MFKRRIMMMTLVMAGAAVLAAGCGPKADPAMVAKMNTYFAAASDETYKGSTKFTPVPFAVGQFVIHGNTEDSGKRSVTRSAVVGREGKGWIIENYTINESSEACSQMLVTGLENMHTAGGLDTLDIVWVKIKDENGQIQTIEGPPLMMAKTFYKRMLQSFDVSAMSGSGSGVDITVPAGTFKNAFNADSEVSVMGMKFRSKSWFHGKVPVNGMVKSVLDDGKTTTELLSFGYSGVTPCF